MLRRLKNLWRLSDIDLQDEEKKRSFVDKLLHPNRQAEIVEATNPIDTVDL